MVEIRVSPERLREVSSQLDSQRSEIDSTLNNMKNMINNLSGEWTGMAQVDYAQIFNDEVPQMQMRMNEIMENLSSELRRIAQTFEDTDSNVI
jgi:WXG100 family type VII secretion target